jgi:16S rRNA (uracil1498-N3)-methyltransferase
MKRYYCPNPEIGRLGPEESHHCLNVMRQKEGDYCAVFDGRGLELKVKIIGTDKKIVTYEKVSQNKVARFSEDTICLAQALTKSKSMDLIIQKATELGVSEIAPLQSDRSVAQVDSDSAEAKVEKWRQIAIDAAKQSGQNWLPTILAPTKPKAFVEALPRNAIKIIGSLQPEARPLKKILQETIGASKGPHKIVLMIGPEGDFTPAEIGEARATGFLPVSLGPTVLRSETAAIYTLSTILYELQS